MRAAVFGLIGLVVGGVAVHRGLVELGLHWPKGLRFALVLMGGGAVAYVLAKLAEWIWGTLIFLFLLGIVSTIGSCVWRAL